MGYPIFDKEHIEELIFDYHEGNLSDSEKAEVMNLIHQHPEFEKDFALWAQTYAHVESKLPDYGLTASLIQKPVIAWYVQTWFKTMIASVMIITGVAVYWSNKEVREVKKENFVEKNEILIPKNEISNKSIHISKASSTKIENNKQDNISSVNIEQPIVNQVEVVIQESPVTVVGKEVPKHEIVAPVEKTIQPKLDSAVVNTKNEIQNESNDESLKRKSKGKKFNFKPSSKFIPVNADF